MTQIIRRQALAFALAAPFLARPASAARQTYLLDKASSEVRFTYFMNASPNHGSIDFGATDIALDLDRLDRSSVDVQLQTRSVRAGFLPATEALRSAALLDARAHPVIRFQSTDIRPSGQGAFVQGNLTLKGITRSETFTARYIGAVPPADAPRLGIQLDGKIDRRSYDVSGFSDFVGPEVAFRIRIALARQA